MFNGVSVTYATIMAAGIACLIYREEKHGKELRNMEKLHSDELKAMEKKQYDEHKDMEK